VIAAPALKALRAIDQEVRVALKEFMHLPQSISNGIIYCRKGDGGLGFPKLEELVPRESLEAVFVWENRPILHYRLSLLAHGRLPVSVAWPTPYG
jgi:hypothetical protein